MSIEIFLMFIDKNILTNAKYCAMLISTKHPEV